MPKYIIEKTMLDLTADGRLLTIKDCWQAVKILPTRDTFEAVEYEYYVPQYIDKTGNIVEEKRLKRSFNKFSDFFEMPIFESYKQRNRNNIIEIAVVWQHAIDWYIFQLQLEEASKEIGSDYTKGIQLYKHFFDTAMKNLERLFPFIVPEDRNEVQCRIMANLGLHIDRDFDSLRHFAYDMHEDIKEYILKVGRHGISKNQIKLWGSLLTIAFSILAEDHAMRVYFDQRIYDRYKDDLRMGLEVQYHIKELQNLRSKSYYGYSLYRNEIEPLLPLKKLLESLVEKNPLPVLPNQMKLSSSKLSINIGVPNSIQNLFASTTSMLFSYMPNIGFRDREEQLEPLVSELGRSSLIYTPPQHVLNKDMDAYILKIEQELDHAISTRFDFDDLLQNAESGLGLISLVRMRYSAPIQISGLFSSWHKKVLNEKNEKVRNGIIEKYINVFVCEPLLSAAKLVADQSMNLYTGTYEIDDAEIKRIMTIVNDMEPFLFTQQHRDLYAGFRDKLNDALSKHVNAESKNEAQSTGLRRRTHIYTV